ncbi:50S ribosomal protein L6 [Patescibacteria group bacterium]|nr:50S ribosomal protein L6 [Patescibacteria group bacterium]
MSRIGKQQHEIPAKTEVTLVDNFVIVKGPLGELKRELRPEIAVTVEDNKVTVNPTNNSPFAKALWGTYASHIVNMMQGVNTPFSKKLILEGVGFKSEVKGDNLVLALGFSHLVEIEIPNGLTVTAEKNNITITGIDKEMVGQFAAKTRKKKKAEPYKGKGFRYEGEVVRRKQGKKNV